MVFRNIFFSALVAGIVSGLVYGVFQQLQVSPIIYAAEQFEVADTLATDTTAQTDGHDHDHSAWSPQDGFQRITATIGANILIGVAYALLLISVMVLHNYKSNRKPVNFLSGAIWGIALFLTVFLAPSILGMHPEIPGTVAAELTDRQIWWVFCVLATGFGLAGLYYGNNVIRVAAIVLLIMPHLFGAPIPAELTFANPDPDAIASLTALSKKFLVASTIGMFIFCLILGAVSGIMTNRFIRL